MMRNIAIGLAAGTIALGGSTLSASALYGKESGIMRGSVQREDGRARELADLTPLQRERLKGITRERYEQSSPVERERHRQGPYGVAEREIATDGSTLAVD
jgi:hypothetical protein